MKKVLVVLSVLLVLSGCATPGEIWKTVIGVSTSEIEAARKDSLSNIFDEEKSACYARIEEILKKTEKVSIYSKNADMIAIYYIKPNDTPVGIFFTAVNQGQTKVEVASPSSSSRDFIAKTIFAPVLVKESAI